MEDSGLHITIVQSPSGLEFPSNYTTPSSSAVSTLTQMSSKNPLAVMNSLSTTSALTSFARTVVNMNAAKSNNTGSTYLKAHLEPLGWFPEAKPCKTSKRKGNPAVFDQDLKLCEFFNCIFTDNV